MLILHYTSVLFIIIFKWTTVVIYLLDIAEIVRCSVPNSNALTSENLSYDAEEKITNNGSTKYWLKKRNAAPNPKYLFYQSKEVIGLVEAKQIISGFNIINADVNCDSLDVCGECESRESRVDRCRVCEGNDLCIPCDLSQPGSRKDACGNCLLPLSDQWNDCWNIVTVFPRVIDRAIRPKAEVRVELTKSVTSDDDITCSLINSKGSLELEQEQESADNWLLLSLTLPGQLIGECHLLCSADNATWGNQTILVVNSRTLSVSSVFPTSVLLGTETQLKMVVHGLPAPMDLVCFAVDANGTVVAAEWTNQVAGNPVTATVSCPPLLLRSDSPHRAGISFSKDAIPFMAGNNTIALTVKSAAIKPITAYFSEDLGSVRVEFTENIFGPSDCSRVFTSDSARFLGTGAICQYVGNLLIARLGSGSNIRPGDTLYFAQPSTLHHLGSSSNHTSSLQIGFVQIANHQLDGMQYRLSGPDRICLGTVSSVRVVTLAGPALWYSWSVGLSGPSGSQRRNLLVWLGAREMVRAARHSNLTSITINSSLLMSGVNYRLDVVGRDALGLAGPSAHLDLQLADPDVHKHVSLTVLCPTSAAPNTPIPLEAIVNSGCGNLSLTNVKYLWKLATPNGELTIDSFGAKAKILASSIKSLGLYNITCQLMNNSDILAKGEAQVYVQVRLEKLKVSIVPEEIILGTGHPIRLKALPSWETVASGSEQWQWACALEGGAPCVVPNSKNLLSFTYANALSKANLNLPSGSLAVGRYRLTVQARVSDSSVSASAVVHLIPGQPPLLSLSPPTLTPTLGLKISAIASDIRPGCNFRWDMLPLPGYAFSTLKNTTRRERVLKMDSSISEADLSISIPSGVLLPETKYKLRLRVTCSAADQVHADVAISIKSPPTPLMLKITPVQGVGLQTSFNFYTERIPSSPVTYSFGFYPSSGPPLYFFTSAYFTSTQSTLPALEASGSKLRTVLRVCSATQLCSTLDGPVVQTTLPSHITGREISDLAKRTSSVVETGEAGEMVATAVSVLGTTKAFKNQTFYDTVSSAVVNALLRRINQTNVRLENDPLTRTNAMLLLEAVTRVFPLLRLNDSVLSVVIDLRNKIATSNQPRTSTDQPSRLVDIGAPMEPRTNRAKRQHPIPPDTLSETPETVGIWLRTSEAAILSFSRDKSNEERRHLVKHLDGYVEGLCKGLQDTMPVYLGSKVVSLSVQKLRVSDSYKNALPVPSCTDNCPVLQATLTLGREFASQYKSSEAGTVCLSILQFPSSSLDLIIPPLANSVSLSEIYRMKVTTYLTGDSMVTNFSPTVTLNIPIKSSKLTGHVIKCYSSNSTSWTTKGCTTSKVSSKLISCKCPAYSYYSVIATAVPTTTTMKTTTVKTTIETTKILETTTQRTTTLSPTTTEHSTTVIPPSSPIPVSQTEVSITTIPSTTKPPPTIPSTVASFTEITTKVTEGKTTPGITTKVTEIKTTLKETVIPTKSTSPYTISPTANEPTQPLKKVAFRIAESYRRVVGENMTEFSQLIKKQLEQQLKLPKGVIQDIYVTKGSILVTLGLHPAPKMTVADCVSELSQALSEGQLTLRDASDRTLEVPSQPLQVLKETHSKSGTLPVIFLAVAAVSICILILIYITVVNFVMKHNQLQQADRIAQRLAAETTPKYLPLSVPLSQNMARLGNTRHELHIGGDDLDSGVYGSEGARKNKQSEVASGF